MQEPKTLPARSLLAIQIQRALEHGDATALNRLIEEHPGISSVLLVDDDGDVGRLLHLYANAPGHRPHPAEIVGALVRDGADIERPGSSINGGPPLQSLTGYGQMQAVRRLMERGAVYFV